MRLSLIVLAALVLAGCLEPVDEPGSGGAPPGGDESPPAPTPTPTPPAEANGNVSFRTLERGQQSGHEGPVREVLATEDEWTSFWRAHGSQQMPPPERPSVDFSAERVVAVVLEDKPSGGYAAQVEEVRREAGEIVVSVVTYTPPAGMGTTSVITNPYHFVAIPQGAEPVRFVEETRQGSPGA